MLSIKEGDLSFQLKASGAFDALTQELFQGALIWLPCTSPVEGRVALMAAF